MATLWRLGNTLVGLLLASVLVASCGAAFHTGVEEAEGGAPSAEAGQGGEPSSGAPAALGGASDGSGGAAGGGGAGGAEGEPGCKAFGGQVYADHCYVDVTVGTVTQPEAAAACEALGAHLLVLDTQPEQDFVLKTFLLEYQDVSDAWLGLTCPAESHPDVGDCHCKDCSTEELAQKQAAWSWSDGTSASFGWVNGNPNATVRCAALGYNPSPGVESWGWVDRACNLDQVTPVPEHPHTYRTICELK